MRGSLIIASHNESDRLWQTVASCVETSTGLDCEIIVADDASWDGSVEETLKRFPQVRVFRHDERKGASPTKDTGARQARGEILVFLDGHTKPEPGAIQRLIEDVECLHGDAIVTPTVVGLCVTRWKPLLQQIGHGYSLELERLGCDWMPLSAMQEHRVQGRLFYESPALIGCAFAVHRELYDDLRGFDSHMFCWGVEDLDFGLKCWLMGHQILHDPEAVIAHRFQQQFDNFAVPIERLLVNQLRLARKNFTDSVWNDWLAHCCDRNSGTLAGHPEGLWARVWQLFSDHRASAEQERAHLLAHRVRDEFWYAERFGLPWPKLHSDLLEPVLRAAADPTPSPSPSPPPCGCKLLRNGAEITSANQDLLPGEKNTFSISCPSGTITNVQWSIPGVIFRDWVGTLNSGVFTAVPDSAMNANPIEFYWTDSGDDRTVMVTFKLDGKDCSVSGTVNIKSLTVTFVQDADGKSPPIGIVRFQPASGNARRVGLFDANGRQGGPGILLGAEVQQNFPTGGPYGKFQFVQILWMPDRRWKVVGPPERCEGVVLDPSLQTWIFDKNIFPFSGPFDVNGEFGPSPTQDQPFNSLDADMLQVRCDDKMYLTVVMFLSAKAGSKWVPLYSTVWSWKACCSRANTSAPWSLIEKKQVASQWKPTTTHPEWKGAIGDLFPPKAVDCPNECQAAAP